MAPGFADAVARILNVTGLDPSSLVLEMTETIFLAEGDRAMTVLADLKAHERPARAGRLRNRVLLLELPARVPDRHHQDRPKPGG